MVWVGLTEDTHAKNHLQDVDRRGLNMISENAKWGMRGVDEEIMNYLIVEEHTSKAMAKRTLAFLKRLEVLP